MSTVITKALEIEDSLPFKSTEGIFLGCFIGKMNELQQIKKVRTDKNLSLDRCLKYCQQKQMKFAAIGNGFQCACGQLYDNLRKTSNGECNKPCPGKPLQACGGLDRIQIHGIKLIPRRFTHYGIYLGCYFYAIPSEMHKSPLRHESMTLDKCMEHCWKNGFPYAALVQGNACLCGENFHTGFLRLSDNACGILCSSDDGNFCGGNYALQVYHVEYLLRKLLGQNSMSITTDLTWE